MFISQLCKPVIRRNEEIVATDAVLLPEWWTMRSNTFCHPSPAAVKISRDNFGSADLRTLPSAAKLELAKRLHYDYNASAKQLQRLISVDADLLAAII